MADQLARMRQIIGTSAAWAAHDLTLGDGEIAIERINANTVRAKVGDGSTPFSGAPYLGSDLDIAAADARYVRQANTVTIGGVAAANKWPRLGADGKLDASLLKLPAAFTYKGTANPTQPPPAGAVTGDVYMTSPGGVVDASWGAPAAGQTAAAGDLLVLGAGGVWSLVSSPFDLDGVVLETDLAGPGGASMTGTANGSTVQQELDDLEAALAGSGSDIRLRVAIAETRAALAARDPAQGTVCFLKEAGRAGLFVYRTGAAPADPQQGLYVPSATTGYWARDWDKVNGRPEWFGAVVNDANASNVAAFAACLALCQTMLLGPADYYIKDVWRMELSGKNIVGTPGSGSSRGYLVDPAAPMGTADGTRIILNGAKVVDATVAVLGREVPPSDDTLAAMRNTHVSDIKFCRDCSVYRPNPSLSPDPVDAVKGVLICGCSDCTFVNLKCFDSPVGFQCFNVIFSYLSRLNVRRTTPASSPTNDVFVGYLVGGYGANSYGLGSNASIYLDDCTVFDTRDDFSHDNLFSSSIGLRLFGRFVDTFITRFEQARLTTGVEIDGRNSSGVVEPTFGAHQDVLFSDCILDFNDTHAMHIHDTNESFCIDIDSLYAGVRFNGCAILGENVKGSLNISLGRWLVGGLVLVNCNGAKILGTSIRGAPVPVYLENCGMCNIQPEIYQYDNNAAQGVRLVGSIRNRIAAQIRGPAGKLTYGVVLDNACAYNTVDETMIDWGAMASGTPASKVRFGANDAHSGFGTNLLTGTPG